MGGTGRKFKAWADYEYGTCVGQLPGNCTKCREAHGALPVRKPPCDRLAIDDPKQCPKYKLYPETWGLHPKSAMAVQLYQLAARDLRAGMDANLIGTLTPSDALAVVEVYSTHMPTPLVRQRTFELMLVLDRAVTAARSAQEKKERELAYASTKSPGKGRARR